MVLIGPISDESLENKTVEPTDLPSKMENIIRGSPFISECKNLLYTCNMFQKFS